MLFFSLNPAKKRKYPESPPSVSPGMVGGMPPGFSINTQIKQEPGKYSEVPGIAKYGVFSQETKPVYTERQSRRCNNSWMMLALLLSLKTMELLKNVLQPHSGGTPLFSMKTESRATSQGCRSVDADVWYKRALSLTQTLTFTQR